MKTLKVSTRGNIHTAIGYYSDNTPAYFDAVCDGIYDYATQDGYSNLGSWIEAAAKIQGK